MAKPLSPAAQAVKDALPSAPHLQMVNRAYAAAALYAAAHFLTHDRKQLAAIADELAEMEGLP